MPGFADPGRRPDEGRAEDTACVTKSKTRFLSCKVSANRFLAVASTYIKKRHTYCLNYDRVRAVIRQFITPMQEDSIMRC